MSVLPILEWPDPRLSRVCDPVGDEDLSQLIADMFDTMYAAPGRGLAAPQVGVLKRLFVMDPGWKDGDRMPTVCIDPEIVEQSEEMETGVEGCLSIPDVPLSVTRPARVVMRWTDADGNRADHALEGFAAKCAQHELDHLNGKVIFNRVDPIKRAVMENAYLEGRT